MSRILVTEKLAPRGIEMMAAAGHEVEELLDLTPEQLLEAISGAHAIIVRSATQITAQLLAAGTDLVAVGRAGIGLDNIDVAAATRRGVMVINAPESNVLSAAEHAFALLMAQARNIPQAHAALVAGRWERSEWAGVELHGKTLGVIGLGRIGTLVVQRALAFGMRTCAYDPYVSVERAQKMGVELLPLETLMTVADFVTIHLPKTPETTGLVNRKLLSKAKPGIRIVNAARGGIIDEVALAEAIRSGQVAGAALDVFAAEPCTSSPLFELPSVVVTPHLGASTHEAQDKAGEQIAEQIVMALNGDFVPYAVNVAAADVSEAVRPFLDLAERLGRIAASLSDTAPKRLEISYSGALAGEDTRILTLSVLKGVFAGGEEPVSYVNAPKLAEERGMDVVESLSATTYEYVSLLTIRANNHAVAGTVTGRGATPRLVMLDDHAVEIPPAPYMIVVRNDDRPGVVGCVGTVLGNAGVSISSMALGQTTGIGGEPCGTALMVLSVDGAVPDGVLAALRGTPGILDVHAVAAT